MKSDATGDLLNAHLAASSCPSHELSLAGSAS
jgi:hypothetical protein